MGRRVRGQGDRLRVVRRDGATGGVEGYCCADGGDWRGTGRSPVARTRIALADGGFVQVVQFVRIRQFVGGRCDEMGDGWGERGIVVRMGVEGEVWEGVGVMREREG